MLVNLQDHIQVVMLPESSRELHLSLIKFAKLMKAFEKMTFATDNYLGYLTVSPQLLGTAFMMECKIPGRHLPVSSEKVQELERDFGVDVKHEGKYTHLVSRETLRPKVTQTKQITDFLEAAHCLIK